MKKVLLVSAIAVLAATAAHAGTVAPPIMEPHVVVETSTSSSSAGIIVPLLFIAAVAFAIWVL